MKKNRRKPPEKKKTGLFQKSAELLWTKQEKWEKEHCKGQKKWESREAFCRIYGQTKGNAMFRAFQIEKREKLFKFFLAGMGMAAGLTLFAALDSNNGNIRRLNKPESGQGSRVYELEAKVGEERVRGLEIAVPEQKLSDAGKEALLEQAEKELYERLETNTQTFDWVEDDIFLPETLCGGLVDIRWESSDYDLMDGSGHIQNELLPEQGEMLTLTARLSCMEREKQILFPLRVMPKGQDTASRLMRETMRKIEEEETEEETGIFLLPDEFEGRPLSWQPAKPVWGLWTALLTAAGCVALNGAFERDVCREEEKRREALRAQYPSFLARLTLLAGTGMPLRMVFARLSAEGAKENPLPVYEEVLRTVREMESGLTELQAYENFGRRTRLPQYKKCASLLAQNVRKGTGDLLAALGQEAENAFEERKAAARKKGEEAQTRLLVPMLLMLALVMILIMVPACFSFGGL